MKVELYGVGDAQVASGECCSRDCDCETALVAQGSVSLNLSEEWKHDFWREQHLERWKALEWLVAYDFLDAFTATTKAMVTT